jgi:CRISPR-associated protein Cas5d
MSLAVRVKVWGDYALFTRPELKVERLSYPVMTPSAARGILDAILFKPQMAWNVQRITVLKPSRFVPLRRNEVRGKIATRSVVGWMARPETFEPYLADSAGRGGAGGPSRTQRNSLVLHDVAYLIEAAPVLTPLANRPRGPQDDTGGRAGADTVAKYVSMFRRRVAKGQCFHRPYLGCREFACSFAPPDGTERPSDWSEGLGLMLYDLYFGRTGQIVPGFFDAEIRGGVLHCDRRGPGPNGEPPVTVYGWPTEVPT